MPEFKPGERLSFIIPETDQEWAFFKYTCGLIEMSRQGTIKYLSMSGTFLSKDSLSNYIRCKFEDEEIWCIPLAFVSKIPRDIHKDVLDKIKYLNKRYQERKHVSI